MGGFCLGGFCPRGDFVQRDFVWGILSGGFCPGGFCPRTDEAAAVPNVNKMVNENKAVLNSTETTASNQG